MARGRSPGLANVCVPWEQICSGRTAPGWRTGGRSSTSTSPRGSAAPGGGPAAPGPPATAPAGGAAGDPAPSGLRWDALAGEWVIIAAQRQDRTFLPPPEECPLDPSREGRLTEIPADDYDVVVFENRFPSLRGARRPGGRRRMRASRRRAGRWRPRGCRAGRPPAAARSSASPPTTTPRSRACPPGGSARSWRRGRTAPRCCPRCRESSRSTASRTGARRSASRSAIRTARSTATPS